VRKKSVAIEEKKPKKLLERGKGKTRRPRKENFHGNKNYGLEAVSVRWEAQWKKCLLKCPREDQGVESEKTRKEDRTEVGRMRTWQAKLQIHA